MKIKLSKSQWEEMGNKAGWTKKVAQYISPVPKNHPSSFIDPSDKVRQEDAIRRDRQIDDLVRKAKELGLEVEKIDKGTKNGFSVTIAFSDPLS